MVTASSHHQSWIKYYATWENVSWVFCLVETWKKISRKKNLIAYKFLEQFLLIYSFLASILKMYAIMILSLLSILAFIENVTVHKVCFLLKLVILQ